ncbi:RNA-directed DNA polymerase [Fusobacterium varium]
MSSNILKLTNIKAKIFFLENENYFNLELPKYINFERLLKDISDIFDKSYMEIKSSIPNDYNDINYTLLHNKDGKYAWRPYKLIHPVMYVSLVNSITKKENWKILKERIKNIIKKSCVQGLSLPLNSKKKKKKAAQILNWWSEIEQQSLALGIEYQYLFSTDITDCYSSIYTHSIAWAIHTKEVAKEKRSDKSLIGNIIDSHLQAMSYGQTNGIPQGSVLMDFIAELLLYYADELITKEIKEQSYQKFKILRYKDDYRVFVNDSSVGDNILKIISEVLASLGLKINSSKTTFSNNIIINSVKEDKLQWLKIKNDKISIQKQLLLIYEFSLKYPNCGAILAPLNEIQQKIISSKGFPKGNKIALISIVTDIAYRNPRTYPVISAILSKLFSLIKNEEERNQIVKNVFNKLISLPNTEYFNIWFQRAIIKYEDIIDFKGNLCKIISGKDEKLWNSEWIGSARIKKIMEKNEFINRELLNEIEPIIKTEEIEVFKDY